MKLYEAKLKSEKGITKVSLVQNPAVETKLSYFATETETPVYFVNQEKQVIYSVAMRPDKHIFRKDVNGEPANVFFSAETVEQCQQSYFKNNGNASTNLNHDTKDTDGIYPFESWIVADEAQDKSYFMNIEAKKGDWIMGFKIENKEVWDNFIKTGEIDGLSIEAFLDYEITNPQINMNTEKTKENFFTHLKNFFYDETKEEEKEKMEEVPAGDEQPKEGEGTVEQWKQKYELLEAENADLKEKIATMEAKEVEDGTELETMKAEIKSVKEQFESFKAEQIAIKNVPAEEKKDFSKMTPLEKFRANK